MCTVKDAPSVQPSPSPASVATVPDSNEIVKIAQAAIQNSNDQIESVSEGSTPPNTTPVHSRSRSGGMSAPDSQTEHATAVIVGHIHKSTKTIPPMSPGVLKPHITYKT